VGDCAAPVDQDPDLAADLAGQLRQLAGQFVGDEAVRRQAPPAEPFESLELAGPEAVRVAFDADGCFLSGGTSLKVRG
jgi:hypothetical protein